MVKKLEEKHLITNLTNHHRKQQEFLDGKRKRHYQKQYSESISGDTESEYFVPKTRKAKKKQLQKNTKNIMRRMMVMKIIFMTI